MLGAYRSIVGLGRNGTPPGGGGPGGPGGTVIIGTGGKGAARASRSHATGGWLRRRWPISGLEMVAMPPREMTLSRLPFASAPRRPAGSARPRVMVYVRRPPHVDVSFAGMGQACDPSVASCGELSPGAVRMDLPAEWLSGFLPPTGEQLSEAAADASTWEGFVTEYSTRAGMAYARLRANLVNYRNAAAAQVDGLLAIAQSAPSWTAEGRALYTAALVQSQGAMVQAIRSLLPLELISAGEMVLAVNVPEWRFAYVPTRDLPADAPRPLVVQPIDAGLGVADIVIIIVVVSLFVAGGAVAWWAAAAEAAKPAEIDALNRGKLAAAQAASIDASTKLAAQAADRGDVATAQAILATSRERFNTDIHSLTEPDWARTEAEKGKEGESIGELVKWGAIALFALKAMETFKK